MSYFCGQVVSLDDLIARPKHYKVNLIFTQDISTSVFVYCKKYTSIVRITLTF